MKRTIKRIALLTIVMALIVGICMPAFAVVYPSAALLTSRTRTVHRGRSLVAKYYLRCGSYTYRYGYRSQLETAAFRNATGRRYDFKEINYTGNGSFRHTFYIGSSMPKGRYNMRMRSYYRNYSYSAWRMCGKTVWWYMYVI